MRIYLIKLLKCCFKFKEGEEPILTHPKVLELEEFLKSNSNFIENFNKMGLSVQNDLFYTVSMLFSEFKSNVSLISRLTKMIKSCQILSTVLVLDEALEMVMKETCDNLICDRVIIILRLFLKKNRQPFLFSTRRKMNFGQKLQKEQKLSEFL